MNILGRQVLYVAGGIWAFATVTVVVMLVIAVASAQKPGPGPDSPKILSEVMALKIGKLFAERQVFEQALLKLSAQQEALRAQTQLTRTEYDRAESALQTVIAQAATEAGLTTDDLKAGWMPNPEERRWVKRDAPK